MLAIAMLMASFFPAMRPEGGMDALLANMPSAFQGLIGNLSDLREFDTYIASQLFDIRVPLIAGIMAIILGLGLSTREEETGELRTLLSLPISRSKLYWQKWFVITLVMGLMSSALAIGVYVVMPFIEDSSIAIGDMVGLVGMTWLIMLSFAAITYGVGMATGKRSVASFISIMAIIGSFLLSTFAVAVDWLQDYEYLSLLHYFPATELVINGVNWWDVAVLCLVSLLFLLIGWLCFRRRDIQ